MYVIYIIGISDLYANAEHTNHTHITRTHTHARTHHTHTHTHTQELLRGVVKFLVYLLVQTCINSY